MGGACFCDEHVQHSCPCSAALFLHAAWWPCVAPQAGSNSGGDETQEGNQLEQLQEQHELYAQQVEQIRQELERTLGQQ